jgi:hypothetical protein
MRIARTSTALGLFLAALGLFLAGCSYGGIDAPLTVDVSGIPNTAVRIDATLTDAAQKTTVVHQQFAAGTYAATPLTLAFAAPANGSFKVTVQAFDALNPTAVANGSTSPAAKWNGAPQQLPIALVTGP